MAMQKFLQHMNKFSGLYESLLAFTFVTGLFAALEYDEHNKKAYYLKLNEDDIQDKVEASVVDGALIKIGIHGETYYLGQKDGTFVDIGSLQNQETENALIPIAEKHKKEREAFKEKFRQCPK